MDTDIRTYDALPAPSHTSDRISATAAVSRPDSIRIEPEPNRSTEARADKPPDPSVEEKKDDDPAPDGYRLSFDSEKRRVYLELLNPATGDVIQRFPRDDLEDAFGTGLEAERVPGLPGRLDVRV